LHFAWHFKNTQTFKLWVRHYNTQLTRAEAQSAPFNLLCLLKNSLRSSTRHYNNQASWFYFFLQDLPILNLSDTPKITEDFLGFP
jgi:hypothetical protein